MMLTARIELEIFKIYSGFHLGHAHIISCYDMLSVSVLKVGPKNKQLIKVNAVLMTSLAERWTSAFHEITGAIGDFSDS